MFVCRVQTIWRGIIGVMQDNQLTSKQHCLSVCLVKFKHVRLYSDEGNWPPTEFVLKVHVV